MRKSFSRITSLVLSMAMALSFIGINSFKAEASEYYPFACSAGQYEVSYIEDDGSLSKVSCHSSYSEAKAKMKELGGDHVVRSSSSLSPTKIVAMNSGIAYSYPARSGSDTMNLYEIADYSAGDIYHKTTYITNHWEMTYHDTERLLSDGWRGMIQISMNGFEGYADLEYTDLVPSKYIEQSIPLYLGGNDRTGENEQPFKVIPRQKYYEAVSDGNYVDLVLTYHQVYPMKNSLEPMTYTSKIGPAPDFMKGGQRYYSSDGIHYYSDRNLTVYVGTDYSYYQYLPLRSKTNISAPQMEAYLRSTDYYPNSVMKDKAQVFIDAQNIYGCNALLVYALACHESAHGTSNYAVNRNNLFGWNAFDADPDKASYFDSIEQAVNEQMGINLRGYVDITDGRFFNSSLGNKGSGMNVKYASDPYWGVKIAAIAYRIDKYANNYNGNLSDYDVYDLALINSFDIDVKAGPGNGSKTLYTTGYGGEYQKDFVVITLGEVGGYTKIQSTNAIDENGNIKTHRTPITTGNLNPISTYDFDLSVAYVPTSDLLTLNYETANTPLGDHVYSLEAYSWNGDMLHLEGYNYVENYHVEDSADVSLSLHLSGNENEYERALEVSIDDDNIFFKGDIDLSELASDTYTMEIVTNYHADDSTYSFAIKDQELLSGKVIGDKLYSFLLKNGLNSLVVETLSSETNQIRQSLESIAIQDGHLLLSGIGLIEGANILTPDDVNHVLRFVDKADNENYYDFSLNSEDAGSFSLNDGYTYKYAHFSGDIDLSEIPQGSYDLKLVITVSGMEKQRSLFSTNSKFAMFIDRQDDLTYKLNTNQLYSYRYELDIMHNELNFEEISKPSLRNSLFGFNSITGQEDDLSIDGYAMMYRSDYPLGDDNYHQLYLVDDSGKAWSLTTTSKACEVDYAGIIGTDYNLDKMCFNAASSLSELPLGTYRLYLSIESDEYYDIIEVTNGSHRTIESFAYEGRTYSFNTLKGRDQIALEISESE